MNDTFKCYFGICGEEREVNEWASMNYSIIGPDHFKFKVGPFIPFQESAWPICIRPIAPFYG